MRHSVVQITAYLESDLGTQRDCVPTVNYTVAVNGPNGKKQEMRTTYTMYNVYVCIYA